MGKHRKGKVKIEHHLLEGLEEYLKKLSSFSSVKSIIPGRIARQNKGIGSKGLFLKYKTPTGYKLLYKNGTSVQEIFVVCDREKFFGGVQSYLSQSLNFPSKVLICSKSSFLPSKKIATYWANLSPRRLQASFSSSERGSPATTAP
jgi:hypothetical protein